MNNKPEIFIPKQPFMVKLADTYYTYKYGKFGISSFYFFKVGRDVREIDTSVPDGCIDLIFHYSEGGENAGADFYGTPLLPHPMKCYPGCSHFGVRFMPGVDPCLTTVCMAELVDKIIPYEQIGLERRLPEQIAVSDNFIDQIDIFLKIYMKLFSGLSEKRNNPVGQFCISRIVSTYGNVRMDELSNRSGYSASYIDKVFYNDIGIAPKKFCSIVRFQWMINNLRVNKEIIKEENSIASKLGYFDQAHMIHDFKKYSNRTPSDYISELTKIDYYERLKVIRNEYGNSSR